MAMARIVCLLLFLAVVNYDHFDGPTDSILQPFVSVDGKRMNPKKSTFISRSRKLLGEPESKCEVGEFCDPMKEGECPGEHCFCEEIRDDYYKCLELLPICEGGETCENDEECVGDCTCEVFYNTPSDGSLSKLCEKPSENGSESEYGSEYESE